MWFISAGVETYATVYYRDTNYTVRSNRRAAAAVKYIKKQNLFFMLTF